MDKPSANLHPYRQAIWGIIWKQTQEKRPMWICICSCKQFEDTLKVKRHINVTSVIMHALIHVRLKNAVKRSNQFYYASIPTSHLRKNLKTHSGQRLNRCSQCNAQCVHSRIRFSCIQNCERGKKGWQWGRSIFFRRHVVPILGVSFTFSVFGRLSPWVTIGEE